MLFASRYEADERYAEVVAGDLPLKGGWRVYSSGPGIYIAHVVSRLLGLRVAFDEVILDPVLARSLDGLRATLRFHGRPVTFVYRVEGPGFGPHAITVNGKAAQFDREPNPYRRGGAVMPLERFLALLDADENMVEVALLIHALRPDLRLLAHDRVPEPSVYRTWVVAGKWDSRRSRRAQDESR